MNNNNFNLYDSMIALLSDIVLQQVVAEDGGAYCIARRKEEIEDKAIAGTI